MNKDQLKIHISERMGICPKHIEFLELDGTGIILQFCAHVRGYSTVDHDDNEYCYLNTSYGLGEIYDIFKANDFNDAFNKMVTLNNLIDKAV